MKKITIIGTGAGVSTLTSEAREAICDAEVLVGAESLLELYKDGQKPAYPCYLPGDVAGVIDSEEATRFAVLVSGDVGFYSGAAGLSKSLVAYELSFIPGISTVNAFFARLGLSWHDAAFVSMHGRKMNIVDVVRRNRMTFCLAGNNVAEIGAALSKAGLGSVITHVGENLGMPGERVYETDAEGLTKGDYPSLTVLLFNNEAFDDRTSSGLQDGCFLRLPGIPMTKSETRAVISSKLDLHPADICWDVGAGTGSVTVEMALAVYRGHVYAVERREDAAELIAKNTEAFHLGNVTCVCGEAPDVFNSLPVPDVVFIGGSGGNIEGIISTVINMNPVARIVLAAVTLETITSALSAIKEAGLEPEVVQLSVARSKKAGGSHLMESQNPVTIIAAEGRKFN